MTDPISNEKLAEMLAGLEGVTPGPWKKQALGGSSTVIASTMPPRNDRRTAYSYACRGDEFCLAAVFLEDDGQPRLDFVTFGHDDAAHIARCDPDTIRSLIEEVQASRRQSPAGVEVKPLEWAEYETDGWADRADAEAGSFGVFYNIDIQKDGYRVVFDHEAVGAIGTFDTAEEAKAAAQADFERRILSSLSVKEPAGVEPVAWFIPPDADGVYQQVSPQHYGDPDLVPLYASPPPKAVTITDEMVARDKARADAIDLLLKADDIWTDHGSGFRVHFSFSPRSSDAVIERVFTARSLTDALSREDHNGREVE